MASAHNVNFNNRERTIAEILNDFKVEAKDFVNTRVQMLRTEMNEKVSAVKSSIPALGAAALFGVTAWFLITAALVALIAMAFPGRPYQYALSLLIVGVIYALIAAIAGMYGMKTLKGSGMSPERTLRVLQQDKSWLQTEAKSQV